MWKHSSWHFYCLGTVAGLLAWPEAGIELGIPLVYAWCPAICNTCLASALICYAENYQTRELLGVTKAANLILTTPSNFYDSRFHSSVTQIFLIWKTKSQSKPPGESRWNRLCMFAVEICLCDELCHVCGLKNGIQKASNWLPQSSCVSVR